jgi:TonB family protein
MARLTSRLVGLIAFSMGPAPVLAQAVEVEAFTVPRAVESVQLEFPPAPAARGQEGQVVLYFMVDAEGRAFDPVVADSIGSEVFQEVALEALSRTRFEPARLNGEAIVGSSSYRFMFVLEGGTDSASELFAGQYRMFQRALRRDERERIEAALAALEDTGANNRYEQAYLSLARYNHAVKYGRTSEQLVHLTGALSGSSSPEDPVYLDEELIRELRRALLPLQLRNNHFPAALDTYALMEADGDDEAVAFFAEAIENARSIELDDTEYVIPIALDDSGSDWTRLYKHNIALTGGEGDLAEVKLRCEQQFIAFAVERDVSYAVPREWGECSMEVVGDPGAETFLLQH